MPKQSKIDIILHPVRMQILQTLIGGRRLTPAEMSERLPHVPQATLYRHINKLAQAGLIVAVEENKVRGAVEKVYAQNEAGLVDEGQVSKEEHIRYFLAYTANLQRMFEQYIRHPQSDMEKDWVTYKLAHLYFTEEEFREFSTDLMRLLEKAVKNEPSPERRKVALATVLIPERGTDKGTHGQSGRE